MKGIIFDLDGVLVDSMPSHYLAWKTAFEEVCSLSVDVRTVYLLEGMRGCDMVLEIFRKFNYTNLLDAGKVTRRKDNIFRSLIGTIEPYNDVEDVISKLHCNKAVVSGSGKQDVTKIIFKCFHSKLFDIVLTANDIEHGKPDPEGFKIFLRKSKLEPRNVLVVENSPLGVKASLNAGLEVVVVLNNSPLNCDDFTNLISPDKILSETKNIQSPFQHWCDGN